MQGLCQRARKARAEQTTNEAALLIGKPLWMFYMPLNEKPLLLLNHIGNELKLLWWQLDAYQALFLVEQEKRSALLRSVAPGFFAITQRSMIESILMRLSRLMDGAKSCGEENSSIGNLCAVLEASHKSLKDDLQELRDDWAKKGGDAPYVRLVLLRNKVLAHNDYKEHSALDPQQLSMDLSAQDAGLAFELAQRLWNVYRHGNRVFRGPENDPLEPIHSTSANAPTQLLIHLCSGMFWQKFHEEDNYQQAGAEDFFESQHMGERSTRSVFTDERVKTK